MMMTKSNFSALGIVLLLIGGMWLAVDEHTFNGSSPEESNIYTERYSGQVGRVRVVFEQFNDTHFRLTTNELIREGELVIEQGYKDDGTATVYLLTINGNKNDQLRYVKLSTEPEKLYGLDSNGEILSGTPLNLERY